MMAKRLKADEEQKCEIIPFMHYASIMKAIT
jgi:hypothetical protein